MYSVYFYKDRKGNYPVKDFIEELNTKSQAKVARYVELLKEHGPNLLRPYADQEKDKIRENNLAARLQKENTGVARARN